MKLLLLDVGQGLAPGELCVLLSNLLDSGTDDCPEFAIDYDQDKVEYSL